MKHAPLSRARYIAAIAAASIWARRERAGAQSEPAIRIGAYTTDAYAQIFYAVESGFLKRAGLNVDVTILANPATNTQVVAANALDVCLADPVQVAHPVNAGVPLAFFAGSGLYATNNPTTLLVLSNESPLRAAKEFEGQSIAVVALASISSLAVREWLRQNGAELERVRLVELPFSSMASALTRGTVAGAFLAEPFLSGARGNLRILAKAYDSIARSFAISTFFASRDWLSKNRDAARRFTQAMYDTARWANTHRPESSEILSKVSKIDVERVRTMARVTYATSLEPAQLQPVLDVAFKYNQLEHQVDARDLIVRI
jgi:NitT/TauT family transport system substrate-binding protein